MFSLPKLFSRSNKTRLNHVRAVNAASTNWPDDPRSLSGAADIRQAGQTVGQRVAGLYINDPVVRSAVGLVVSQIVGSGVRLNTPDQALDARFNSSRIDLTGVLSVTAVQRAAIRCWIISGEVLGLHRVRDGHYAFQLLDPEQLDRSKNEDRGEAGTIVAGVERDQRGVITGYWILPHSPGDPFASNTQSARFDVGDVVHVFETEFPGQVRGISPLVAVLPVLNQASVAVEAKLKQIQVSAMFAGAITSPDGTDPFDGDDPNPSLEPGALIRLRPGENVEFPTPPQSPDFQSFMKTLYRQIAAAIGVTYEDLIGDLEGVNYSSFRGGALTARRKAEAIRKVLLIEGILDPIFRRWHAIENLASRTKAEVEPGWIEPAWPQIDPEKEAAGEIALLNARLKSRKEIIEARGREFETVSAEIEADPAPLSQGSSAE